MTEQATISDDTIMRHIAICGVVVFATAFLIAMVATGIA